MHGSTTTPHHRLTLVAWILLVGASVVVLWWFTPGPLVAPLGRPSALRSWLATRPAEDTVMATVRLVTLALACYLEATTCIGLVLRLVRLPRLVSACDLITLPSVRWLLGGALNLSLIASPVVHPPGAQGWPSPAVELSVTNLTQDRALLASYSGPVLRWLPPDQPGRQVHPSAPVPPAAHDRGPDVEPAVSAPSTWTVQPGDSFWRIATVTLARPGGHAPSDAEIVPYWRTLISSNASRLVDPENADFILPGQVFVLPPPPGSP